MISETDIRAAEARIRPHIRRTPALRVAGADLGVANDLVLKLELLQHTGTFKARGAFNSLLSGDIPKAGVVAASGGNHGAAVAFAAARLGIPARIFVPEMAGATKIALIRDTGADLVVVPGAYADAYAASLAYQAESGAGSIHAYDAPATLTGQATLGLELEEQAPDLDILLIAVGGGGLIGGVASWYRGRTRIIAVEPEQAPTLNSALATGPDTEVEVGGIAANALGARKIGEMCHRIVTEQGIESVLVPDAAIADAQHRLWSAARIAAEPAGAAVLAALTTGAVQVPDGAEVGLIICGGNLDPGPFEG
ncbi:MAG: threonine/serine dehydratase [Pseudomonadota bacterium]